MAGATRDNLRKSLSIVLQDNHERLHSAPEKTANDLGRSYRVLHNEISAADNANNNRKHFDRPPLPQRNLSFDSSLRQRGQIHLQSADLFENFSPVQKERQLWAPILPDVYSMGLIELVETDAPELPQQELDEISKLHPRTFGRPCLVVEPSTFGGGGSIMSAVHSACSSTEQLGARRPLRCGIVLSGGPAPGGHNVIGGVFDYMDQHYPGSQLFGFMGGLDGLFQSKYRLVDRNLMSRFMNQGGFDMLWSGRGRIQSKADLADSLRVCSELGLEGLVIVGGDGSLSNAALISEYFEANLPSCAVVGVPKTIDGDLRNAWIETSFGFDTAAKTYSELIGNLCTDALTSQMNYHLVRVMGRSASHLVVECALQTRPNLVLIGEEIENKSTSLQEIVMDITNLIIERKKIGKLYGIILVPEGLIEFVPEIRKLINALNEILASSSSSCEQQTTMSPQEVGQIIPEDSKRVWDFLPEVIQEQLLGDRESTGYIQVAKIATERLLKLLVEAELQRLEAFNFDDIVLMPHYFGYEGRCAMPSNFDANYCYTLGYTAALLADKNKNGYISTARHLDQNSTMWIPGGIPFTRVMEVKCSNDSRKTLFPAVIRQLFDLKGPLFKVLCEVREEWRLNDYYRCPGSIQFEGPVADIATYTVSIPTKENLLSGLSTKRLGEGRAVAPKWLGAMSDFQRYRMHDRPVIPDIYSDRYARASIATQYLTKDPFTQRQVLSHYPYICNSNQFYIQEIVSDAHTKPVAVGLKVGVVFLSRQAPGCANILWGVHERLKLVGGKCIGFFGMNGLLSGKCLEITDSDLELYLNQGGMELLGRAAVHSLLLVENQEKVRLTCTKMLLDGLVIVGSSLAMTEAALTAEYFLAKGCRTSIIGIPASGSNNLTHELIETNIGFDTSSKLYANLIGNVLTDAASMPKYWHFVRIMGRQPSTEVLECALQTHPNVVIIAEEYGAANKTLWDVVNDIADVVCRRADQGKNFGSVLIPDGLLSHLPNMKALMNELSSVGWDADNSGALKELHKELSEVDRPTFTPGTWTRRITPWSLALFKSLPKFIRRELTQVNTGELRFTLIETELLLSQMVKQELSVRKSNGKFSGKFAAVCHFFGYQGRSAMPSKFDAKLAFAYGHLACICVESGLTAHCGSIRGLCGEIKDWKSFAIPFNSMLAFSPSDDVHPKLKQTDIPIIPSAEVSLSGKAYRWMRAAVGQWQLQDRFCNPGPVQFTGNASDFYHRILHEEQAEYFNMLKHVQLYTDVLRDTCSFGVNEDFLKQTFANLHGLLSLRFHSNDLMSFLPQLADVTEYEEWQGNEGQRKEIWGDNNNNTTVLPSLSKRPSLIAVLGAVKLQSRSRMNSKEEEDIARLRGTSSVDAGWGCHPGVEAFMSLKTPPNRKLAVWRSEVHNKKNRLVYVTLSAEKVFQPRCFAIAKTEKDYLAQFKVTETGRNSSIVHVVPKMSPYAENWSANALDLSHWYLPQCIIDQYDKVGVSQVYPWQAESLELILGSDGSKSGCESLLYSAPTSGGKSLVADILMLRRILFEGRGCMVVLPHVALCDEKVKFLKTLLAPSGVRVEGFHSNEGSAATWHSVVDVAVCTIEKANSLMNRLISELVLEYSLADDVSKITPNICRIGTIVIDEIHLIGDPQRGYLLELLLTKVKRLSNLLHNSLEIQIVGLSATLPNMEELANWLDAKSYKSELRPLPLDVFIKLDREILRVDESKLVPYQRLPASSLCCIDEKTGARSLSTDPEGFGYLVYQKFAVKHQVLVFCSTKDWCVTACDFLTKVISGYYSNPQMFCVDNETRSTERLPFTCEPVEANIVNLRKDLIACVTCLNDGMICNVLKEGIQLGIAYHHASMSLEERSAIEDAYKKGALIVLCATSTLAVGVNLPVSRVIFRSTQIGRNDLTGGQFRQMSGRAGRKGFDLKGEAIVMCQDNREVARVSNLLFSQVEPVKSAISGIRLARLILEIVTLQLVKSIQSLFEVIQNDTLRAFQNKGDNLMEGDTRQALLYLFSLGLIQFMDSKVRFDPFNSAFVLLQCFSRASTFDNTTARTFAAQVRKCRKIEETVEYLPMLPLSSCEVDELFESPNDFVLTNSLESTKFGRCIVETSVTIGEGIFLLADLYASYIFGLNLKSELNLLVLVSSPSNNEVNWNLYESLVDELNNTSANVASMFSINKKFVNKIKMVGRTGNSSLLDCHELFFKGELRPCQLRNIIDTQHHCRFFEGLILYDCFHEIPLNDLSRRFGIRLGRVCSIKQKSLMVAGIIVQMCQKLNWVEMGNAFAQGVISRLQVVYTTTANEEISKVPLVVGKRLLALSSAGYNSIESLAAATPNEIELVLEKLYRHELNTSPARARKQRYRIACQIVANANELYTISLKESLLANERRRRLIGS